MMSTKRTFKITIDFAMTIILPFLMAYEMVGEVAHEWIGSAMFLLFILHHVLNYRWHKSLTKGSYSSVRILGTGVNLLLFFFMVFLMLSGIILSKHTFAFLSIDGGSSFARKLHLFASYWGFALMSVHIGLHGVMFIGMIKKAAHISEESTIRTAILRTSTVLISAYGVYAIVKRQYADYMFLKSRFVFFDFDEPLFFFIVDYFSIMGLFAFSGYYLSKILIENSNKKLNKNNLK